jgi:hypothetical protein
MADTKLRHGGCHCGKVRYEAETDLAKVMQCNCSICSKKGLLVSFVAPDKFKLVSGDSDLRDYQFNKHVIHHLACDTCGVESFARGTGPGGTEMIALNVRCLDDIDVAALTTTPFDGRKL